MNELLQALRHHVPAMLDTIRGSSVDELRLESGDAQLTVIRAWQDAPADSPPLQGAHPAPATNLPALAIPGRTEVRAQVVGVFHHAREADGPALAKEGDHVDVGTPIGVIETLGIANDVNAPVRGRLSELLAQDGQAVEFGELIAVILPE